jgi:hypothetical protein
VKSLKEFFEGRQVPRVLALTKSVCELIDILLEDLVFFLFNLSLIEGFDNKFYEIRFIMLKNYVFVC